MNDEDLLGYFEIHSRTERALFNSDQIARLYKLAGRELPPGVVGWMVVHAEVADPLVKEARARARAVIEADEAAKQAAEARQALTSVLFQLQNSGLKLVSFEHPLVAQAMRKARDAEQRLAAIKNVRQP